MIAAITLATGHSYEQVLGIAMGIAPEALVAGLEDEQALAVIRALGAKVKRRLKFDLDDDTGILIVEGRKKERGKELDRHAVYLWEGRIVEPSLGQRALWLDAKAYLADHNYKAVWLFVIRQKED